MVPARPRFIGKLGWVRSSTWIWLFSSTRENHGVGWRIDVEANGVRELGSEGGGSYTLNLTLIPVVLAIAVDTRMHKALLAAPDHRLALDGAPHDLGRTVQGVAPCIQSRSKYEEVINLRYILELFD